MTGAAAMITTVAKRRHVGIEVRHRGDCPANRQPRGRCRCAPAYRAAVWISDPREAGKGRKATRTFDLLDDGALVWRSQAVAQARRDAGASLARCADMPTVRAASDALVTGMESGAVRKRNGAPYRAGVVRAYRRALDLDDVRALGGRRLDGVSQLDLLELVERLQAAGLSPSSIRRD